MSMQRYSHRRSAYLPLVKRAVQTALKYRKQYRTSRQPNAEPVRTTTEPLTGQFDYKTDYKQRRYSKVARRRIKNGRKYTRRIMRVVNNNNTGSIYLVRRSVGELSSAVQQSNCVSYGLNGLDGSTFADFNTTNDISFFLNQKDPTAYANWNIKANQSVNAQVYVKHATMEMTVRNTGSFDAILEAYFIVGRRPLHTDAGSTDPKSVYEDSFNKQAAAQDPDTGALYPTQLDMNDIGVTPFQAAWFCRHYKIYKRTKFRIPPGGEINLVLHSRSKTFWTSNVKNYVTDKRFHGILFQQQGGPAGAGLSSMAQATACAYLSVRRYTVKFMPVRQQQDALT